MKASLKVFFENPFWVGVFERIEDGKLSVCKVTFGVFERIEDGKLSVCKVTFGRWRRSADLK